MAGPVTRPLGTFKPGHGLLRNEHFQVAYVTNDMARARQVFADRFGIANFQTLAGDLPTGGYISVALAWVGGTMYELVQARGPGSEFYMERLPADEFAIRHHHLGFLVGDDAGWDALRDEITAGGWETVQDNVIPGLIRAFYIDVPELGHFLEYMQPEPDGVAFLENVPAA